LKIAGILTLLIRVVINQIVPLRTDLFIAVKINTLITLLLVSGASLHLTAQVKPAAAGMPHDLSGLAWIEGDAFLAVHDSKSSDEKERPRVSILWLPKSQEGVTWKPIDVDWPPPFGLSSDLESMARVPGTSLFLLIESGEGRFEGQQLRRVFLAEYQNQQLKIAQLIELPAPVSNVEGAAVARLGNRLIFIFAERADHQPGTSIRWADLQLEPLKLGPLRQAWFKPTGFTGPGIRPVSAIETDEAGRLYIASAFDPEDDNGPFRSVIWSAGQIKATRGGRLDVIIDARPRRIAMVDGFKVESLAARQQEGKRVELFAGTDDENYGSTLRLIP
jgi:hypothetical protein